MRCPTSPCWALDGTVRAVVRAASEEGPAIAVLWETPRSLGLLGVVDYWWGLE